jgi:hypothetical protein
MKEADKLGERPTTCKIRSAVLCRSCSPTSSQGNEGLACENLEIRDIYTRGQTHVVLLDGIHDGETRHTKSSGGQIADLVDDVK